MVQIKRERWRNKFVIVVREKGRIQTWAKWSRKFNNRKAKEIFKKNNTFSNTRKIVTLTNVKEVVDFSPTPKRPSRKQAQRLQYFFEIKDLQNNIKLSARSKSKSQDISKKDMKEEAQNNVFGRYAYQVLGESDPDEGIKHFNALPPSKRMVRQGFVYYQDI